MTGVASPSSSTRSRGAAVTPVRRSSLARGRGLRAAAPTRHRAPGGAPAARTGNVLRRSAATTCDVTHTGVWADERE